jgi:hypothetical protein
MYKYEYTAAQHLRHACFPWHSSRFGSRFEQIDMRLFNTRKGAR